MRAIALPFILVFAAACGRSGMNDRSDDDGVGQQIGGPSQPTFDPKVDGDAQMPLPDFSAAFGAAYPGHQRWMSYVVNDGTSFYNASNQSCTSPASYRSCLHAGEVRKLELLSITSCANLSATDSLGLFDWVCDESSGTATFYSRLKKGRGLRDLLDSTGGAFATNQVVVDPIGAVTSTLGVWFDNPVESLPQNAATAIADLSVSDTVYVATTTRNTFGYHIAADRIAVVTMPGVVLDMADAMGANCNDATGGTANAGVRCVVTMGAVDGAWIEANLDANRNGYGEYAILAVGARLLRVHGTRAVNAEQPLHLDRVVASRITETSLAGDGKSPATPNNLVEVDGNLFREVFITRSNLVLDGNDNVFDQLNAGNGFTGVELTNGAARNVFGRVVATSTQAGGIRSLATDNHHNVFAFVTGASNLNSAIVLTGGTNNTVHSLLGVNNFHGLHIGAPGNTVSHVFATNNNDWGILVDTGANNVRFAGQVQTNSTCGIAVGLVAPALTTACLAQNLSVGHLTQVVPDTTGAGAFVAAVLTDDASNTVDASGGATFPASPYAFDFTRFANPWRAWGKAVWLTFPQNANAMTWVTGTGNIWDWSLVPGSTAFEHSGDATVPNDPFVDGATCPTQVHGDRVIHDIMDGELVSAPGGDDDGICEVGETCAGNVYLYAAMEIIDDDRGDDDYLCESNEACIYAPNFGAYQGSGDYRTHRCVFEPGVVTGVTMYAFPVNGE